MTRPVAASAQRQAKLQREHQAKLRALAELKRRTKEEEPKDA
jgi:hypothetical protein